jgi:putative membrane protein
LTQHPGMHEAMHHPLAMPIAHLLLTGVSVVIVAWILPGIQVASYWAAVIFAFIVAILNAIAWHVLGLLTIPFAVLTLGIGALIVNGIIFLMAGGVVRGVEISGCFTAALASLGVTFVNWLMYLFLGKWAP